MAEDTSRPERGPVAGTMDQARPQALERRRKDDRAPEIGRPLPHLTPSGGGHAPTPDRSKTPAAGSKLKGVDNRRPVTEVLHARDRHDDFVQVPLVSRAGQPAPDLIGECLTELERPLPHSLMAEDDAAGGQHLLDHTQAEWEAEIQPNHVADDLGRKPLASLGGNGGRRHPGWLRDQTGPAKPPLT